MSQIKTINGDEVFVTSTLRRGFWNIAIETVSPAGTKKSIKLAPVEAAYLADRIQTLARSFAPKVGAEQ